MALRRSILSYSDGTQCNCGMVCVNTHDTDGCRRDSLRVGNPSCFTRFSWYVRTHLKISSNSEILRPLIIRFKGLGFHTTGGIMEDPTNDNEGRCMPKYGEEDLSDPACYLGTRGARYGLLLEEAALLEEGSQSSPAYQRWMSQGSRT